MPEPPLSDARLIFGFAHDLRGYLRTILTRVQMVQLGGANLLPEPDRAFLDEAAVAAADMNRLLSAMVAYYDLAPTTESMGLRLIIRGVLMDCKTMLADSDASVSAASDLNVNVSKSLQRVLKELLNNSCRFRRRDQPTVIEIETRINSEFLEMTVSDNGLGVDAGGLSKIFVPFQRMHSRSEFPGFGLGLAMCERLVTLHGGTISATASASGGLAIHLTMPILEAA